MRLQVAVLRHDLPEVRFIYNTASKHGPGITRLTTVADLLSAVNALVPIESPDGEWGLEDYVVEVAATADQSQTYECFHFQEINDVLREDDEVVIRGLTNEELRHRRQGGRLQITRDGRHLIDGLSWGRRWRAGVGIARPQFTIPPRKRRRIMEPEPESGPELEPALRPTPDEDFRLELEYPPSRQLVPFVNGEEAHADEVEDENEDDEDYEYMEDEEVQGSDEDEEEAEDEDIKQEQKSSQDQARQVIAKASFENSDSVDENEGDEDDANGELSEGAEDFTAELEALTADAGAANVDMSKPRRTRSETFFEKFPSPLIRPQVGDVNGLPDSAADSGQLVEEADETSNTDMFVFKGGSNGDSFLLETSFEDNPKGLPNGIGQRGGHSISIRDDEDGKHSVSSSEDESSEEDSSDDSSSSDSESESSSDEDNERSGDSSDEDSDSGESNSSSDSSFSSIRSATKPTSPTKVRTPSEKPQGGDPTSDSKTLPRKNNPPGTGQNKTKRNNERKKLSKLLSSLKEAGKLDPNADFRALRQYLAGATEAAEQQIEIEENEIQMEATQDKISARADEILARLNKVEDPAIQLSQDASVAIIVPEPQNDEMANDMANSRVRQDELTTGINAVTSSDIPAKSVASTTAIATHQPTDIQQGPDNSSSKRTQQESDEASSKRIKLDVAASRRMLFSSLGVRNPKTAEAENALREKLAKPVRQVKSRGLELKEGRMSKATLAQDRWKKKFSVLAVECVQEWKKVAVPPFPFKQPWQVRQERVEMSRTERQQETYEGSLNYDDVEEDQDTQSMDVDTERFDDRPSQSMTTSRTLTAGTTGEDDDVSEPSDFSILPALTEPNVSRAAFIAYKELHMNARFEPEESPYRVARVLSQADNTFRLRVVPRYRRLAHAEYDEETKERQYHRFEVPIDDDDDEPDDGFREVEFSQMIHPKIVTMLSFRDDDDVAQDAHQEKTGNETVAGESSLRGGHLDKAVHHFAQTLENEDIVSTSRRTEINDLIKEAGFNSAVDGQLLQGLTEATAQDETSLVVEDESPEDVDATRTPAWQSDSLQPTSPAQGTADVSAFRESSAPSESMVESVKYPQLSELEVNTPMPAQSSSHQDTQNPTPTPILPAEESTNLEMTFQESADQLDQEPHSLPSEVPQTQSQDLIPDSLVQNQQHDLRGPSPSPISDMDPGLDNSISPRPENHTDQNNEADDDDDDDSIDSNGFPSIRALTSSQAHRLAETNDKKSAVNRIRHSPPEPTRRSPRTRKTTARSSDWSDTDSASQQQPQTSFKASQSQPQKLSQIPEDTIYVDLTQSSPANSPDKGKEKEGDKALKSGVRRGTKDKGGDGAGGGGKGPSNIFRKSFEGLGEKSYLKRKKKSL